MITAQSVRYPAHLFICASVRVIISGPQCPMLLGDSVHHYLHSVHLDRSSFDPLGPLIWNTAVLYWIPLCPELN